jgi:hypothetical protein
MSQTVNAAIAFTDALAAKQIGRMNQRDHAVAIKALGEVLGNWLPVAQESRPRRILSAVWHAC